MYELQIVINITKLVQLHLCSIHHTDYTLFNPTKRKVNNKYPYVTYDPSYTPRTVKYFLKLTYNLNILVILIENIVFISTNIFDRIFSMCMHLYTPP